MASVNMDFIEHSIVAAVETFQTEERLRFPKKCLSTFLAEFGCIEFDSTTTTLNERRSLQQ
jgi:hypothetical protein